MMLSYVRKFDATFSFKRDLVYDDKCQVLVLSLVSISSLKKKKLFIMTQCIK